MKKLTLALPKGRILKELDPLLKKSGIEIEADFFDEETRKLVFQTNLKNLQVVKVRSFDVATFVKFGGADLGVCGLDVIEEFNSPEIYKILNLEIGKCRLSIAGKKSAKLDLVNTSKIQLASKYVNLSKRFFDSHSIQARIIKLNGAIEIAPILNLSELFVDLVSTGKTLAQNNMVEIKKILDVSSYLIVNRTSFKRSNLEINQIIDLLKTSI